jgi:MurNAc alpha-1-phosphate uridylyltransferase
MGVCMTHAGAYAGAPAGKFSNRVVFDAAEAAERLFGVRHDGAWFHVGTPEARAAAEEFLNLRFAEA